MRSTALIALLIAPSIAFPAASQAQPYSELDVRRWGNVYDVPATRHVTVRRDVPFHVMGARTLAILACHRQKLLAFVDELRARHGKPREFRTQWPYGRDAFPKWRSPAEHARTLLNID